MRREAKAQSSVGYSLIECGRPSEGEAMLRQAVDAGYPGAQYNLSWLYDRWGREEAVGLLQQAVTGWQRLAQEGDPETLTELALTLRAARRAEEADEAVREAVRRYEQSAADGDVDAMCRLRECHDELGDRDQAEVWARRAARSGSAEGEFALAGLLLERGDEAGAVQWFKKAARHGHAGAMFNLSLLQRSPRQTKRWLRRAARAGERGAMNNLGVIMKQEGRPSTARTWYLRAIELGDPDAERNLGLLQNATGL